MNKAYKKPYTDLKKAVETYLQNAANPKSLEDLRKAVTPTAAPVPVKTS